jgi:RIO-like serine/threonine protein kinase
MSFYAQEKFSYAKPPNLKSAKLGPKFTLPKKLKDSMHGVCSRYERFNPGKQDCTRMDELIDAVEDTAQKAGILTGDLHEGNWGKRPDGSLVILDFGQSKQKDKRPAIRQLAGLGKDIAVLLGVAALAAGAVWLFKKRSE